jgi:predicted AAA+ superfamily ATPase
MPFLRKIYPLLKAHAEKKQVSIVTGMRRTGKTTLIKQILADCFPTNSIYIDLERLDNRMLFRENNYDNILSALKQRGIRFDKKVTIAIDEAQHLPELPSVVKYFYDTYDIKFLISGSSSYYLKNLFTESLAGRKKIFELYPLDFGEFLTFKSVPWSAMVFPQPSFDINEYNRLKSLYEEYIEFGGFPEVVLQDKGLDKTDLLDDIISSYIMIDIKWLADFRNEANIRNLIAMLASRAGTKLDIAKIAALTGISKPTVTSYVELFEKTYLIYRLNVLSNNPDREIVKAKKLYFTDNGLLNRLARLSSGVVFENAIFNQLKTIGELNYYAQKNGKEIDFILNKQLAVEVKETAVEHDLANMQKLSVNLGIRKNMIISRFPSKTFGNAMWGGNIK